MTITRAYLSSLCEKLARKAAASVRSGRVGSALKYVRAFAFVSFKFKLAYTDKTVNGLLKDISGRIRKTAFEKAPEGAKPRCVFLDSLSILRGGLTVQYMRAVREAGWDVLYLTEQNMNSRTRSVLRDEILSNPNARIKSVPSRLRGLRKCQYLYDAIASYRPDYLIIHVSPYSPHAMAVCYALPDSVRKFLVDYTDHSFLLGIDSVDCSFEFRDFGASVSRQYRGLEDGQIVKLPFYPVMDKAEYRGLPDVCNGKTLILSGGNYWKIVDENDTFFKMVKGILDSCPDAVIVFAGAGNRTVLDAAVRRNGIGERFVILGWRDDISNLFSKCDIFLDTYPFAGGLMDQYAARYGKAILSYDPYGIELTEELVCQTRNVKISSNSMESFLEEAVRLVNDEPYRKAKGEELKSCTLSVEEFNACFRDVVSGNSVSRIPVRTDMNCELKEKDTEDNIKEANSSHGFFDTLVSYLGVSAVGVVPLGALAGYSERQARSLARAVRSRLVKR